jgi:hypothetical protein
MIKTNVLLILAILYVVASINQLLATTTMHAQPKVVILFLDVYINKKVAMMVLFVQEIFALLSMELANMYLTKVFMQNVAQDLAQQTVIVLLGETSNNAIILANNLFAVLTMEVV